MSPAESLPSADSAVQGASALQNNAGTPAAVALTVGGNNGSTTYSGTLSGSGSLTKVGTGMLTLTGSNTYAGTTAISAGTLAVATTGTLPGYASTGRVTAASSGTLTLSAGSSWTAANINSLVTANGTGLASGSTLGIDTTSGNFSYGYSIAGNMGLTKLGSNVLTLSSSSTYTGLTTVTSGTLTISNSSALSGSTVVAPTPGNLTFATNVYAFTFGGLSGSQNLSLQNNGAVALTVGANNASTTYAGALIGSGSLTKTGSGMLTLIGSSTYSGVTTISSGTLRFGDGISGHDGSLVATGGISNNAALVYNLNGPQTYAGIISGTGTLTKTGSGTLVLANANTFSGGTTISAGTLQLGNGTSGNDGSLSNTGGINDNATLVFNLYGPKTYSGTISGLGNMTKAGNGTLTLSGSSTFSGTTTLSGGTLKLSNANALQASTVTPTTGSLSFDTGIASFTFGGLGGSGNISLWNTASSPIALTVGGNNTSTTYSGVLSGSGGSLTKMGVGTLTLTGPNTFSGGITVGAGALTLASSGTLTSATDKTLYVGNSSPATMTIQDNAAVSLGGELDVNFGATQGSPSTLTINSSSTAALTVGTSAHNAPTVIGRASMNADPASISAAVYQSSGGATLNGLTTVGNAGTATSLYDINGGTLAANAGLQVGYHGNGYLNIHGSGVVNVTSGGLVIGQDASLATSGRVNLSAGTLSVTGSITFGSTLNKGIGTLSRTGGTMTVTGDLAIDGNATLILDDTIGSAATSFGGKLTHGGAGTMVIVPQHGHLDLSTNGQESISVVTTPTPSGGIVGTWAVREASGSDSSGDYLAATASSGAYRLVTATYTSTNFQNATAASVVEVTANTNLSQTSVSAVKFGPYTTTIGTQLTVKNGGLILNSARVTGGTVTFPDGIVPLVYVGSSNPSRIESALAGNSGLVKFGPGSLVLSGGNSGLSGDVVVSSGTLNLQNALALGGTTSNATVASGASLEIQGNTAVGSVPITLNGAGSGGGGALRNVQDSNSLAGTINLGSNSQINSVAGTLTLSGPIQGNYALTKTGSGTLVLAGSSSNQFPLSVTVAGGTLRVQNSAALGPGGTAGASVAAGATLQLQGGITVSGVPLNLSGAGTNGSGALESVQGNNSLTGAITLAADSQVNIDNAGDTLTLSGAIGGGSALTKGGAGTLVLSGNNSFSGAINVLSGTLSAPTINSPGSAGPLGVGTVPVTLGSSGSPATLLIAANYGVTSRAFTLAGSGGVFRVANLLILSGVIDGNGSLTQAGGFLRLTGKNLYTGATIVSDILDVYDTGGINNTSAITINQGASFRVTAGSSLQQLPDSGNITLNGGNLNYVGNGSISGGELAGALVLNPGQNTITTSRSGSGYTPYLAFASVSTSHTTGATVSFVPTNSTIQFQANPPVLSNSIIGGYAFYVDPSANVDFATVSATSPYTVQQYAGYTTGDLGSIGSNEALNVAPSGGTITVSKTFNSLKLTGSAAVTINSGYSLALNSGGLIGNTTGTISGGGSLSAPNDELIVNAVQHLTIASAISASGALVKTGSATLTLTSTTAITGDTYLNQGTLEYNPTGNLAYAGSISGAGDLLKSGTATLTLSGTSTYTGGTTVTGGKLSVNGSLGVTSVSVQGAALTGSGTVGGNVTVSGSGTIAQSSSGSITGMVTDTSGSLTVGQSGVGNYLNTVGGVNIGGTGTLVASSTAATITGSLNYTSSSNSTYSGIIVGSGSTVTLNSSSGTTLTLSGSDQHGGGTVVQGGTLKAGNANALGTGGLTLTGGSLDLNNYDVTVASLAGTGGTVKTSTGTSTLTVNPTNGTSTSYSGTITGSGTGGEGMLSLTKSGSGTLTLSSSNSYMGGTTVTGGTLIITNANALPPGGVLSITGSGTVILGSNLATAVELGGLSFDTGGAGASSESLYSTGELSTAVATPTSAIFETDLLHPFQSDVLPIGAVGGGSNLGSGATAPVPEPGTFVLLFAAAVGLGLYRLRRGVR